MDRTKSTAQLVSRRPVHARVGLPIAVDIRAEVLLAIERIWAQRLEDQAAGRDFNGQSFYFVATDVEREVREEAARRLTGSAHGGWPGKIRISGLHGRSLLGLVRRVLSEQRAQGKLESHNHGRGHCSGERFRAAGSPLSPAEEKSLATPRAEKVRRKFIRHAARADGKALCGADDRKRSPFSCRDRHWKPKPETDSSKVTCKRCQALLMKDTSGTPQSAPEGSGG